MARNKLIFTKDSAVYMNPINLQDLNPRGIFFNSFRKHYIISDNPSALKIIIMSLNSS